MVRSLPALVALLLCAPGITQGRPFYEQMDFGPFVAQTFTSLSRPDNTALKGVAIRFGTSDEPAGALFDTELLRVAALWNGGFVSLRGTPFDGSHGPHSSTATPAWFETDPVPGWSLDGEFRDPRPIPGHGPLPRDLARYRGLYRAADRIVFAYDVAGSRVLDSVVTAGDGNARWFVRSLELAPCRVARTLLLASYAPSIPEDLAAGVSVVSRPAPAPQLVSAASFDGAWTNAPWGAPRGDLPTNEELQRQFGEALAPPPASEENPGRDRRRDRRRAPTVAVRSLPAKTEVHRIHTYAEGEHAVQRFTLYGHDGETPPVALEEWTRIAEVDPAADAATRRRIGDPRRQSVAIASPDGRPLGTFRHLLFVGKRAGDGYASLRFAAVDALGKDHGVALPASFADAFALRGDASEVKLVVEPTRAVVRIGPHARTLRFDVLAWHGDRAAAADALAARPSDDAPESLEGALRGGPSRFTAQVTVQGVRGPDDQAYTVDTIPVPFDNPYRSWMRTAAFDFFADGTRAAISTWNGDVWIVSGIDDDLHEVTWRRFATGLFDPLGLKIVDDVVHTLGRDGITRLHDLDGDGEADFYEAFNHDVLITEGFHEFAFDLHTDPEGRFYFSKAGPVNPGGRGFQKILPHHGCILRVSKDGEELEVYATGFRANNGIGVGPQGQVTSGDNEGTWMPKCRLSWVKQGSFNGCVDTAHRTPPPTTYDKPLCWLPHDVDNSSGSQVWVTSDRFGPLQGSLLHLSYGTCSVFLVLPQEVDGQMQGGVVRLPLSFASSCMRARFNPRDGQLYVCGLKGWQTSAAQDGAFQRVRYTGKPLRLPVGFAAVQGGVLLTFSDPLDPETANDPTSYGVEVWDYLWASQYGSPHLSVSDREGDLKKMGGQIDIDYRNSDVLPVTGAELRGDRQVFVAIAGLRPVMQMKLVVNVDAADGEPIKHTIYATIHAVPQQ